MRIDIVAGARPNFMKIAPIIREIQSRTSRGSHLRFRLVHTGQHYDRAMSEDFFDQLGIPVPDVNLGCGSGTQAEQTAAIMIGYERLLREDRSAACLVVGDVTSTMACAIVSQKLHVPVAHVEAGIRSGDWSMPEEINRLVTDAITNWFFTTSEFANENLRAAGVGADRILFVGNTMIDTLLHHQHELRPPAFWSSAALCPKGYLVMTLHRPSNVDDRNALQSIVECVARACDGVPVVFPVHPRTRANLQAVTIPEFFHLVEPQPYLEFNYLVKNSAGVVTDSGGITEEATVLGVPCVTLRDTTERPETVSIGTNELTGSEPSIVAAAIARILAGEWKRGGIPPLWDGMAAQRIVNHLERLLPPSS